MKQELEDKKVPVRVKHVNKLYKVIAEVGSGTYGRVYKAKCLKTNEYVALKKIETKDPKIITDGFPITALREIKLLKQMNHKNVINLCEIILSKPSEKNRYRGSTFLVFDYMDHDFEGLQKNKYKFDSSNIKCIMKQILEGVKYLHDNNIVHRDLKIANILLNNKGEVKLADFGLARTLNVNNPNMVYTNRVVTLWYRAPELLFGARKYSTQIDMWSIGCIFGEFLANQNLFRGDGEYRQMEKIYELCGNADERTWPGVNQLQGYQEFQPRKQYPRKLKEFVKDLNPDIDDNALNLLDGLLTLDPKQRLTAAQALQHPYFSTPPFPTPLECMPKINKEYHETLILNEKKNRKEQPKLQERQQSTSSDLDYDSENNSQNQQQQQQAGQYQLNKARKDSNNNQYYNYGSSQNQQDMKQYGRNSSNNSSTNQNIQNNNNNSGRINSRFSSKPQNQSQQSSSNIGIHQISQQNSSNNKNYGNSNQSNITQNQSGDVQQKQQSPVNLRPVTFKSGGFQFSALGSSNQVQQNQSQPNLYQIKKNISDNNIEKQQQSNNNTSNSLNQELTREVSSQDQDSSSKNKITNDEFYQKSSNQDLINNQLQSSNISNNQASKQESKISPIFSQIKKDDNNDDHMNSKNNNDLNSKRPPVQDLEYMKKIKKKTFR